jgi:hypothetical protein
MVIVSGARMSPRKSVVALVLVGLTSLPAAVACAQEGLRCPSTGRLVQVGDSSRKVEKRCGPPDAREPVVDERCTDQGYCTRRVGERWTYDFGQTYFVRYLLFWNGRLAQIEEGEYGEKP